MDLTHNQPLKKNNFPSDERSKHDIIQGRQKKMGKFKEILAEATNGLNVILNEENLVSCRARGEGNWGANCGN